MSENERDRRLDAAWSAASREEPPPALDAAIRAAARRAVGASPAGRRHKHWWYPLAAAATVALLAVGIAQLTPPEQVAPATVADTVDARHEPLANGAPQAAAVEAPVGAPPPTAAPATPAGEARTAARPVPGTASGPRGAERARIVAVPARQEPAAASQTQASPPTPLAGAPTDLALANTAPSAPAPASAASPRAEPFPAAAPAELRREGSRDERSMVENAAGGASIEPVPARNRLATAQVAHAETAKTMEAPARGAEEWIKRIRTLKNEGRLEDAAKELAMFRSAYGERAEALLPADLREIKR